MTRWLAYKRPLPLKAGPGSFKRLLGSGPIEASVLGRPRPTEVDEGDSGFTTFMKQEPMEPLVRSRAVELVIQEFVAGPGGSPERGLGLMVELGGSIGEPGVEVAPLQVPGTQAEVQLARTWVQCQLMEEGVVKVDV